MPVSLETLEERLRLLVPARYQEAPAKAGPMGSAGLQYGADGTVAWDKIWGSFCDLALAGGPPHKGSLLQAASGVEIAKDVAAYRQVTAEIVRGIGLVTGLDAEPDVPGWVRVSCASAGMAGWLLRAITIENIAVRAEGSTLFLPAGPAFRLDKEIKNVITVIAKTTHYWCDHMPASQQWAIADLFPELEGVSPLIQPGPERCGPLRYTHFAEAFTRAVPALYPGWLGMACETPGEARTLARLLIASNVLARCEGETLFVACNPQTDPEGTRLIETLRQLKASR